CARVDGYNNYGLYFDYW
nr:immunoglobulin heavy chain junction region [Macaca mulatta]